MSNFSSFNKKCQKAGLVAKECSPYHWQITGGKFLVNYFMGKKGEKIYVGKTNHSISGDFDKAIKCANELPEGIEASKRKVQYRSQKKRLFKKSNICSICKNIILNENDASLDHIIPLSKGGMNNANNYQLTHKKCNQDKGNKV